MKHSSSIATRKALDLPLFFGLILLLCSSVSAVLFGTPSTAKLLDRASSPGSTSSQVRAMNALSMRGYFEERPRRELQRFLRAAPGPVADYVRRVQPQLLRPRLESLLRDQHGR